MCFHLSKSSAEISKKMGWNVQKVIQDDKVKQIKEKYVDLFTRKKGVCLKK